MPSNLHYFTVKMYIRDLLGVPARDKPTLSAQIASSSIPDHDETSHVRKERRERKYTIAEMVAKINRNKTISAEPANGNP